MTTPDSFSFDKSKAKDLRASRSSFLAYLRLVLVGMGFLIVSPVTLICWAGERFTSWKNKETWKRILMLFHGMIFEDLIQVGSRFLPNLAENVFEIYPIEPDENRIGLTIDDAPGNDPDEMHKLLDVLKEFDARCTFFCTTNYISIKGMDEVMKRAVREGHQLANHMPEDRPYISFNEKEFETELLKSHNVLKKYVSEEELVWFRAPMGKINKTMVQVVQRHYKHMALGTVFSGDPFLGGNINPPQQSAIDFHVWYNEHYARPGSIIIFHVPNKQNRRQTVPFLKEILSRWTKKGWKCVSLGEFESKPTEEASLHIEPEENTQSQSLEQI